MHALLLLGAGSYVAASMIYNIPPITSEEQEIDLPPPLLRGEISPEIIEFS